MAAKRPRHVRRYAFAAVAAAALVATVMTVGNQLIAARMQDRLEGEGAVVAPVVAPVERPGRFEAELEFGSLFSEGGRSVRTQVAWDDSWFFQDPTAYNHELAITSCALAAIANAESSFYQAGSTSPAYVELALASLGFSNVQTESYRYRSEVFDEVADAVRDSSDVAAYFLGSKVVTDAAGAQKMLVLVGARGSYGSEWISNTHVGTVLSAHADEDGDHWGFTHAVDEVFDELGRYDDVIGRPDLERAYLICGHSRGGALANLLAARLDDLASTEGALAPASSVYGYAFATPNLTRSPDARDASYGNVFNVLNPSDIVVRLLPEGWGYARYGVDVWLPALDQEGFAEGFSSMGDRYRGLMGATDLMDPADRDVNLAVVDRLVQAVLSAEELESPWGLVRVLWALWGEDYGRILRSHYNETYLAWMLTSSPADLTFWRGGA